MSRASRIVGWLALVVIMAVNVALAIAVVVWAIGLTAGN